jgi:TFIIF-interacting CTD phosphatase-like protein
MFYIKEEVMEFTLDNLPRIYYVKFRPHCFQLLQKLEDKYEMTVYTMGSRSYAKKIVTYFCANKNIYNISF